MGIRRNKKIKADTISGGVSNKIINGICVSTGKRVFETEKEVLESLKRQKKKMFNSGKKYNRNLADSLTYYFCFVCNSYHKTKLEQRGRCFNAREYH